MQGRPAQLLMTVGLGAALLAPCPTSGFLLPPVRQTPAVSQAPAGSSSSHSSSESRSSSSRCTALRQQLAAPSLAGRRRAAPGNVPDGEEEEADNTPGKGSMPNLEGFFRPSPEGGESVYEFGSEYPDQQAVRDRPL